MQPLAEIEEQLETAYEAVSYSTLKNMSDEQLLTRQQELWHLRKLLIDTYGLAAKEAVLILDCELYDLSDALEDRS